ncbi:hypothetical protein PoB_006356800 [Plakobranchus ocellatus]|uniref:Uncharacterized protein n=1 Tax=Plakobranchus ocellatus TaxID=259542 RepID=A0AAV4CYQ7_9GAST|nr:hypothetical protein PoB_006356800 [Plakobranchus ocellatus]
MARLIHAVLLVLAMIVGGPSLVGGATDDFACTIPQEAKEFHQYYSYTGDHSVLDEREYGHREYGYAQYSTGELLVVTPSDLKCILKISLFMTIAMTISPVKCTVTNLATSDQRFIFGYKRSDGKGHVPSPESLLHMFQKDQFSSQAKRHTSSYKKILQGNIDRKKANTAKNVNRMTTRSGQVNSLREMLSIEDTGGFIIAILIKDDS